MDDSTERAIRDLVDEATQSGDYTLEGFLQEMRGLLGRTPCTCGFGGFHDDANPRCERNQ